MASHLNKGSFRRSFTLCMACTISILFISVATVSAETFSRTGKMSIARLGTIATQLLNGKVLIAGGGDGNGLMRDTAELYNPATGTFSPTGNMIVARDDHTTTLLTNGQVLVTGGVDNSGTTISTAELYNPSSGTFASTGSMAFARRGHAATLLASGEVLITGGLDNNVNDVSTAELYDPATGSFAPTGSLVGDRSYGTATLLPNGEVLVAGGNTAELYDPSTGTFTPTSNMLEAHFNNTATLLFDGRVLIAGGLSSPPGPPGPTSESEIYDPASGTFAATGSMTIPSGRYDHTATLLANGQVLMAGGFTMSNEGGTDTNTAELYDASVGTYSATGNMTQSRSNPIASLLNDGLVLVTMGPISDLYKPATMPFAKIMSPVGNSVVQNTVIISTAVRSQVQRIKLYVDGNYITSSPPYNFTWDSTKVANGSHTISIKAFNLRRRLKGTDSVTVNVAN
jgi:hypothetical protein